METLGFFQVGNKFKKFTRYGSFDYRYKKHYQAGLVGCKGSLEELFGEDSSKDSCLLTMLGATAGGHKDIMLMIDKDKNLDCKIEDAKHMILSEAIKRNCIEIFDWMINLGANIHPSDCLVASKNNNLEILRKIHKSNQTYGELRLKYRRIKNWVNENYLSWTSLKLALEKAYFPLIKHLLITGSILDMLTMLGYLMQKHSNVVCNTLDFYTPEENLRISEKLSRIYYNNVITYDSIIEDKGEESERLNISDPDNQRVLIYPRNLKNVINKCKEQGKKFLLIPLILRDIKPTSHANYLVLNLETNKLERYEPHGGRILGEEHNPIALNNLLSEFSKKISDAEYFPPPITCSGTQSFEGMIQRIGTAETIIGGYCSIWSTYYAELRISNPTLSMEDIYDLALQKANGNWANLRKIIKEYSGEIKKSEPQIIDNMQEPLRSISKERIVDENTSLPYMIHTNEYLAKAICEYPDEIKNLVKNGIINLELADAGMRTIFDWMEVQEEYYYLDKFKEIMRKS